MIKRAIAMLAIVLVSPAMTENRVPDHAAVSATIAALKAGNVAELEWLVAESSVLQFPRVDPLDRTDAIKTLSRCQPQERSRVALGPFDYYEFEWKCRKQTYVGKLIPERSGKAVALIDLVTKPRHGMLSRSMPRVFMPPLPITTTSTPRQLSTAEQAEQERRRANEMAGKKERAELFAQAVASGDMSNFRTRHATVATITYGFFDPYSKQDYVDKAWRTGDTLDSAGKALSAAVAYGRSRLGQPVNWACQDVYPYVECTWRYRDPGTRLKAKIHVFRQEAPNWGIIVFEFRYETAAKMQGAKRRAAR